jgi:hypothetical protein
MHLSKRKLTVALFVILTVTLKMVGEQPPSEEQNDLCFRFVGPKVGNRISAVAGIPGDPGTYYAGAASGAVWKSTDGGNRFVPIFDKQPAAAIRIQACLARPYQQR